MYHEVALVSFTPPCAVASPYVRCASACSAIGYKICDCYLTLTCIASDRYNRSKALRDSKQTVIWLRVFHTIFCIALQLNTFRVSQDTTQLLISFVRSLNTYFLVMFGRANGELSDAVVRFSPPTFDAPDSCVWSTQVPATLQCGHISVPSTLCARVTAHLHVQINSEYTDTVVHMPS